MAVLFTPREKCVSGLLEELLLSFTQYEREVLASGVISEIKVTVQFWDHQFYTVIIENEMFYLNQSKLFSCLY